MFKIDKILGKENRELALRYVFISILSYGFVFIGLIILVNGFNIKETLSFIIIYGINYIFLYVVQLRYLFKTNHNTYKLIRFIAFILFFYTCANIIYNIGLNLNLNYLVSTAFTIVILMPFRIIASKLFVFKN
ncbi:hypothetical protein D1816_10715 [Aquimarina sp. AD10]|nr:hypothetical protein D1816_10715 [Aquimarina sp. AD10]RKM98499.1 hypothetical protein D7033_12580 [Aquimarina sp. AD10]